MLTHAEIAAATLAPVKGRAGAVQTETKIQRWANIVEVSGWVYSIGGGTHYWIVVQIHEGTKVWCKCGCPYFRFTCQYVLWANGSSDPLVADNRPPEVTNPTGSPQVCKHVWALLEELVARHPGASNP